MKTLSIILTFFFLMLVSSCSSIHKFKFNDNTISISESGQIHELQLHNFSEIPKYLVENLDKMGLDNSSTLNEYEGRYLNCIFNIDAQEFNLVGKKVGFLGSKIYYFTSSRSPDHNSTTVGGSSLYILDSTQKVESGGYDAAITYWNKILLPIEYVVERLKNKHE